MQEVRAHGWAKVEQCRSNCREHRRSSCREHGSFETCRECGGDVRIIASIEDPVVISKILAYLSEKATPAGRGMLPKCRAPPRAGLLV